MTKYEECYLCSGEVEPEVVAGHKEWVCQECGNIIDSEEVIEEQEEYVDDDVEVME